MARRAQPLRWRTLQDVADVLLATTTAPEGHTLAEAMERIRRHHNRETEIFTATTDGSAKDRQTYDTNLAEFDRLLASASAMARVQRAMKKDAEAGRWVAFGRRHPDAPEEAIPPYYWPFLDIDMEEDSAKSHDLLFRGIRRLLAEEIPADHPILEQIRPKEAAGPVADEQPVEDEPSAHDSPASPPPVILYSGTQGRPSSVETLVIPELRRRAAAGIMESSLARECLYLSQWLHATHPTAHQIKPASLENSLRQLYRELKTTPTKH